MKELLRFFRTTYTMVHLHRSNLQREIEKVTGETYANSFCFFAYTINLHRGACTGAKAQVYR